MATHTRSQLSIVLVPGWNGSEPEHWQSIWHQANPDFLCVEQRDWAQPTPEEWIAGIDGAVAGARRVVLVAHSLGCHAVALWANRSLYAGKAAGALMVAPPNLAPRGHAPAALRCFSPAMLARLPFPATLVGSENDPYMTAAAARRLAGQWGCEFVNGGRVGHLNVLSGHGPWPEGEGLLRQLLDRLNSHDAVATSAARCPAPTSLSA